VRNRIHHHRAVGWILRTTPLPDLDAYTAFESRQSHLTERVDPITSGCFCREKDVPPKSKTFVNRGPAFSFPPDFLRTRARIIEVAWFLPHCSCKSQCLGILSGICTKPFSNHSAIRATPVNWPVARHCGGKQSLFAAEVRNFSPIGWFHHSSKASFPLPRLHPPPLPAPASVPHQNKSPCAPYRRAGAADSESLSSSLGGLGRRRHSIGAQLPIEG